MQVGETPLSARQLGMLAAEVPALQGESGTAQSTVPDQSLFEHAELRASMHVESSSSP